MYGLVIKVLAVYSDRRYYNFIHIYNMFFCLLFSCFIVSKSFSRLPLIRCRAFYLFIFYEHLHPYYCIHHKLYAEHLTINHTYQSARLRWLSAQFTVGCHKYHFVI